MLGYLCLKFIAIIPSPKYVGLQGNCYLVSLNSQ